MPRADSERIDLGGNLPLLILMCSTGTENNTHEYIAGTQPLGVAVESTSHVALCSVTGVDALLCPHDLKELVEQNIAVDKGGG